jgi:hypothetical protein
MKSFNSDIVSGNEVKKQSNLETELVNRLGIVNFFGGGFKL